MSEQTEYVNLDFLPPVVERLAALPEALSSIGCGSTVLKVIDNFPWGFDCRMQSSTAYPESIIAHIAEQFEKYNIRFSFIFPGQNDFSRILRLNGYRRLASNSPGAVKIDAGKLGFLPLVESIAEDFLSLCPAVDSLIIQEDGRRDEEFYNQCAAGVKKIRTNLLIRKAIPGYRIAEEFLSVEASGLCELSAGLKQDMQDFSSILFELKRFIAMSSLGSNSPAASGENLECIYEDLHLHRKSLDKSLQRLIESAEGLIEPGWLELYSRSVKLSAEDELVKIESSLRLAGLLN